MRPLNILRAAVGLLACAAPLHAAAAAAGPAALTQGKIKHVMVIELENEDYGATFGSKSPATYLNGPLLKQGELIVNYYATSHVSLANYLSQISGQAPTISTNDDCLEFASIYNPTKLGKYTDVVPGTDAADQTRFPGQVVGDGCVYPAPAATRKGARTIGDQLDDRRLAPRRRGDVIRWREYAEDMGADIDRDHGDRDSDGIGADCAHPPIGGQDLTNTASRGDQYADRHNPFIYFHSVIDDTARCDAHVVPLGAIEIGPSGDTFRGHLFEDLSSPATTPDFMFVTPNLCDDGHDAICRGPNIEGGATGGLAGADLWLKHYMPMILASPTYQDGSLMVVITFDEGAATDAKACPNEDQATCGSPTGPNVGNPGFSTYLGQAHVQTPPAADYVYPGGGQVGAVVFNKRFVTGGAVDKTGVYNHYSALRSYEDLLGLTRGGDDGRGHLGYASGPKVVPFGSDVFNNH